MKNLLAPLIVLTLILPSILVGCKQGGSVSLNIPTTRQNTAAPVQLGGQRNRNDSNAGNIRIALDKGTVVRSIENYRINKRATGGSYKYIGADLNGDGQAEVLVYLTGPGWCARTGCTLAILAPINRYSYEPISTIRRVKKPITIASERTNGWLDIHIRTGVAQWPKSHKVTLKFSGNRYPGNAVLLTPHPRRFQVVGDEVFPPATDEERRIIQDYIASAQ